MTGRAWIWDTRLLSLLGGDEAESVGGNVIVFDGLLDVRHVAGHAIAAWAVGGVVGVLADGAA